MKNINTTTANRISRTPAITAFLNDARRYKMLNEDEILNLIASAKAGNEESAHAIINANLFFIFSLSSKFAKGDEILDLVSQATIGMMRAIHSFDETKGVKFLSYAVHCMHTDIATYYLRIKPTIYKTNSSRIRSKVTTISNRFFQSEERLPTEEELLEILDKQYGIKLYERSDVSTMCVTSISAQVGDDDSTAEQIGEFAVKSASENDFVNVATQEENERLSGLFLKRVTEKEREVIKMYFGFGGKEPMNEEAIADVMGCCRERIRQIKEGALKKMRLRKDDVMELL